jgi:hypothetical protein
MTYSELGRYFSGLTNDKIDRVAQNSEVSRATIYKIRAAVSRNIRCRFIHD